METDFLSCCVDLKSAVVWAVRDQCLLSEVPEVLEFNIKLDGRPLGGMYTSFHD